jgi:Tfp pilus assembly protein PilP
MKLTIAVLAMGMAAATAWGQNPDAIQNTRDTMKAVQKKKQIDSDAALGLTPGAPARPAQPAGRGAGVDQVAPGSTTAPATQKAAPAAKAPKPSSRPAPPKTRVTVASQPKQKKQKVAVESGQAAAAQEKPEHKRTYSLSDRRDPFISPVVSRSMVGSGCSTGKRCLAIDQIALKGVVRSEGGMIAVVVNALDKAYFLRENDPVFNGYVVKITGDSIVFKETVQDRLGKPLTREVTKKITTPAV